MKVIDILNGSQRPFASFELVPPLKGSDASRLYQSLDPLMEFHPPFVNITCHRDEVEFVPNGDGSYTRMTLAKRPGTVAIAAALMRHTSSVAAPRQAEWRANCLISTFLASTTSLPCVAMPCPDKSISSPKATALPTVRNWWR